MHKNLSVSPRKFSLGYVVNSKVSRAQIILQFTFCVSTTLQSLLYSVSILIDTNLPFIATRNHNDKMKW